jgi:hypothetical protein
MSYRCESEAMNVPLDCSMNISDITGAAAASESTKPFGGTGDRHHGRHERAAGSKLPVTCPADASAAAPRNAEWHRSSSIAPISSAGLSQPALIFANSASMAASHEFSFARWHVDLKRT